MLASYIILIPVNKIVIILGSWLKGRGYGTVY
jgi:hypothetical protein